MRTTLALLVMAPMALTGSLSPAGPPPACAADNAGLAVPAGFCATAFAEGAGPVRHLVALPNGDVLAAVGGGSGGVLFLRDTNGDGKADVTKRFGPGGGNGITYGNGYLYFATNSQVVRWPWQPGQTEPAAPEESIVEDLPVEGTHTTKSLALGPDGSLFVSIGSASNSCQQLDRGKDSPGFKPCTELKTRAGIWQFSASKPHQHQADGVHWATGIRNAVALTTDTAGGGLFALSHGRDQLGDDWGFNDSLNAELPAEELAEIHEGTDLGWPYCYYDQLQGKKVQAPEYGGDGRKTGQCGEKQQPLAGFPGHWAPMAIAFYHQTLFPESYRGGAFIAFHGSWNRAPLPQAGYRVVFVPFAGGKPSGQYETFASIADHPTGLRASGLAVGPDGALFIAGDANHEIWRVVPRQ